jgi:hypothetical protein
MKAKLIIDSVVKSRKKSRRIVKSDCVEWHNDAGHLHREDGPAIEWDNGSKFWYINGKLHRLDGPAMCMSDGRQDWYKRGELHRVDGPAWIDKDVRRWYQNGKAYRADGPSVEYADGTNEWRIGYKLHRIDGPAIEGGPSGKEFYYVDGRRFTEEEFYRYVDHLTGEVIIPPGKKLTYD